MVIAPRKGNLDSGKIGLVEAESGKILPVKSGIIGFGIRNTAQGIRNPTNKWNPESQFNCHRLEFGIHSVESRIQDCHRAIVTDQKTFIS